MAYHLAALADIVEVPAGILEERLFKALPVIWAEVEEALELPGVMHRIRMAEMAEMVSSSTSLVSKRITVAEEGVVVVAVLVPGLWVLEDQAEEVTEGQEALSAVMARPTQEVAEVARGVPILGRMAVPASSSSATSPPPAATKAAARTITTTGRTASRARLARRGCPKRLTSAYARKTTTAASTATCTRAPRALRVPHGYRAIPSRAVTRRRAPARCHRHHRLHPPRRWKRSQRRRAIPSSPTSPTRD